MATNRRVRDYRRRDGDDILTRSRLDHLVTGCAGSSLIVSGTHYASLERFAEAWEEYRGRILSWFAEHCPDVKPFAYWLIDVQYPQDRDAPGHVIGHRPPDGPSDAEGDVCHRVHATWFAYPAGAEAIDLDELLLALAGD
jgi:hypothetical protein